MFVSIINDCNDDNAMGRQLAQVATLFGNVPTIPIGVGAFTELEAAGNLLDILDNTEGEEGVVLVNVAPRHGRGKKWPNGTPFGYFWYKKTLVVSTIAEQTLSLVKKFGIADSLQLTDIPTVIDYVIAKGLLSENFRQRIVKSKFRSLDYIPRLAKWIIDGFDIPSENYSFNNVADVPHVVWYVDNFGECKLSALPEDVGYKVGKKLKTKFGDIMCYEGLKDVPNDEPGIIMSSSGFGEKRFLEFVIQGQNTAKVYNLHPGSEIF